MEAWCARYGVISLPNYSDLIDFGDPEKQSKKFGDIHFLQMINFPLGKFVLREVEKFVRKLFNDNLYDIIRCENNLRFTLPVIYWLII